jgi:heterotetrameric sarcosine oxidase gamma subunit
MPDTIALTNAPAWTPIHPFADLAATTLRIGTGEPGVILTPVLPGRVTLIVAKRNAQAQAETSLANATAIMPPQPGSVARSDGALLVWTAPGQWLHVMDETAEQPSLDPDLAALSDQTGARVFVRISGPRAADALAKGLLVDLHPRVFGEDAAATTSTAHIGLTLWRDGGDGFVLATARSTAADLWHYLVASAAQYGVDIARD